jgi:2Fe-2S ferredoxin
MVRIIVQDRQGDESEIHASSNDRLSLMEAIRNNSNMALEAICGGMMSCSTCHVYVDPIWMDKIEPGAPEEEDLLRESDHYRANSRLSCQIAIAESCDGLRVTIAPEN